MARAHLRSLLCSCGCGQYRDVAHDPAHAQDWWIDTETCFAGAALQRWRDANPEPDPGTLVYVRSDDKQAAERSDFERLMAMRRGDG